MISMNAYLTALAVAATLALLRWLWLLSRAPVTQLMTRSTQSVGSGLKDLLHRRRAHRNTVLAAEQSFVSQRAELLRVPVAIHRLPGSVPTLRFSDGTVRIYPGNDPLVHKRLLESGSVSPGDIYPGKAPKVLSEWSLDECRQWQWAHRDLVPAD